MLDKGFKMSLLVQIYVDVGCWDILLDGMVFDICLIVNGVLYDLYLDNCIMFLDVLCEYLYLIGIKKGCDYG